MCCVMLCMLEVMHYVRWVLEGFSVDAGGCALYAGGHGERALCAGGSERRAACAIDVGSDGRVL